MPAGEKIVFCGGFAFLFYSPIGNASDDGKIE
jgi:hypothetical protein